MGEPQPCPPGGPYVWVLGTVLCSTAASCLGQTMPCNQNGLFLARKLSPVSGDHCRVSQDGLLSAWDTAFLFQDGMFHGQTTAVFPRMASSMHGKVVVFTHGMLFGQTSAMSSRMASLCLGNWLVFLGGMLYG